MSYGMELRDGGNTLVLAVGDRTLRQTAVYAVTLAAYEQTLHVPGVTTTGHCAVADNGASVRISAADTVAYSGGYYATGSTNIRVMEL